MWTEGGRRGDGEGFVDVKRSGGRRGRGRVGGCGGGRRGKG